MRQFGAVGVWVLAVGLAASAAEPEGKRIEMKVGDVTREALVFAPAKGGSGPRPLVFVFHGHGGSMKHSSTKMAVHEHWPDAVCVYPQGLNTPGKLTDPEGKKTGWQQNRGEQDDRDLKFFDELLKAVRKDYSIDDKRVYVTGHSNGGRFTYLLWAERGEVLAAVAPSASPAGGLFDKLKSKPCLHLAGEKDELVKFASQQKTMEAVRKINGCAAEGKGWNSDKNPVGTLYPAKEGAKGSAPFASLVYPGGHTFPADAPKRIAEFFKSPPR